MLVAVTGFGSVWRTRFSNNEQDPKRFARGAYFNTTGVMVNGQIRQRPRIVGYAKFNGVGGFDPNFPSRMINRVFDCADMCVWNGENKVPFGDSFLTARCLTCSWLSPCLMSREDCWWERRAGGPMTPGCWRSAKTGNGRKPC